PARGWGATVGGSTGQLRGIHGRLPTPRLQLITSAPRAGPSISLWGFAAYAKLRASVSCEPISEKRQAIGMRSASGATPAPGARLPRRATAIPAQNVP